MRVYVHHESAVKGRVGRDVKLVRAVSDTARERDRETTGG
jgi:hypothetical protein